MLHTIYPGTPPEETTPHDLISRLLLPLPVIVQKMHDEQHGAWLGSYSEEAAAHPEICRDVGIVHKDCILAVQRGQVGQGRLQEHGVHVSCTTECEE